MTAKKQIAFVNKLTETRKNKSKSMTPPLVDHAHTDSYIVIGCNLVQPRRKMNMFISGRSHITVITVSNALRPRHSGRY